MQVLGTLVRIALVFGLLGVVLYVLRRTEGFRAARRSGVLQVLGSTRLGKGAALTVVRIGEAEYVLGVTDHTVTLLTPTGTPAPAPAAPAPALVAAGAGDPTVEASPGAVPTAGTSPATEAVPTAAARPDFAAALGARLGARLSGAPATAATPPTAGEFLRSALRVARRQPGESTELSVDAVTAALANVRGEDARPVLVPAPRITPDAPLTAVPRTAAARALASRTPAPRPTSPLAAADGSAAPTSRHALRRAVARTDALRDEEHPWTRSCRPTARPTDRDAQLL